MKILVENQTKRVVGIFADTDTITLEPNRVVTPNLIYGALGADTATVYENVTLPTDDQGRYTYDPDTGAFTDTWPYKDLTRVEFLELIQAEAGVTDAQLVAAKADANLGAFWLKFELSTALERDNPRTQGGLDALIATGYTDAAGKQAILDAWPRARP